VIQAYLLLAERDDSMRAVDSGGPPMEAMRELGSFGDERLKKGALISLQRWSISVRPACGGLGVGEAARFGLADFCTIPR
jgi:hypothetical protein